jgi:protein SCO1/2
VVSNQNYRGKIWVAEFFFASCPTICPIMNTEMKGLYNEMKDLGLSDKIQFLSFSIDPNRDTPKVLKAYKKSYCDACLNWDFLTGDEEETHKLGIDNFLIFAGRDEEAKGGYAHSGAFSLVDTLGHVRGVYNITDYDGKVNKSERQKLYKEIQILLKEI